MRRFLLAALSLTVLAGSTYIGGIFGCGGSGDGGSGGGVVSINDLDGATDVAADSVFKYIFSQAVDSATVTQDTFFMVAAEAAAADISKASFEPAKCDNTNKIDAIVSCLTTTECTLDPAANLGSYRRYYVCLSDSIRYSNGNPFEGFMATFTTAGTSSTYTVGGTVTGLGEGELVILQNNSGDDLTVAADGAFTFATQLADDASYDVGVSENPPLKECLVSNGTGVVAGADVTSISVQCSDAGGIITTVAGTGTAGYSGDDGLATSARINATWVIALDSSGNLFIADTPNYRIRKVDRTTGIITTVAGTGTAGYSGDGGLATNAQISDVCGVAVDSSGNLFISDSTNYRVRKVDRTTGIITTVAGTGTSAYSGDGGLATVAELQDPRGIAFDSSDNLFIADTSSHRIRRVDKTTGIITRVAGTGVKGDSGDGGLATSATFFGPQGVAVDDSGNLYIADSNNLRVRKVDSITGIITTVAGNGVSGASGDGGLATEASIGPVYYVDLDSNDNLFIPAENRIRKVDQATGIINTVAGTGTPGYSGDDGMAIDAELNGCKCVSIDSNDNYFILDYYNYRVRMVTK